MEACTTRRLLVIFCLGALLLLSSLSSMGTVAASEIPTLLRQGGSSSTAGNTTTTTTTTTTTADATTTSASPVGIVIVAQARSGSTMLGEIFRHSKDVLYLYEPCRTRGKKGVMGAAGGEVIGKQCFALAQRICRCEFTLKDSDRLARDGGALKASSPALMELSRAAANSTVDALVRAHDAAVKTCKKSKAVVVKLIRTREGISGPGCKQSGLKFLHLVRDPRAVVRSELETFGIGMAKKWDPSFHGWGSLSEEAATERAHHSLAKHVCHTYRHQRLMSETLSNDRYMMLRYEDFAARPSVQTELVYRWAGLGEPPATVSKWVDKNTQLPDCDPPAGHGARRRLSAGNNSLRGTHDPKHAHYSTPNAHQEEVPRTLRLLSNSSTHDISGGEEGVGAGGGGGGGGNDTREVGAREYAHDSLLSAHPKDVRRTPQESNNGSSTDSGGGEGGGSGTSGDGGGGDDGEGEGEGDGDGGASNFRGVNARKTAYSSSPNSHQEEARRELRSSGGGSNNNINTASGDEVRRMLQPSSTGVNSHGRKASESSSGGAGAFGADGGGGGGGSGGGGGGGGGGWGVLKPVTS